MYICMYVYIYIYIYIIIHTFAETALQPLMWCSESISSQRGSSSPEECFFHRHRHYALRQANSYHTIHHELAL